MDDISLRAGQLHQWLDFAHVDREQQLTFRNLAKLMSKVRQPMSTLVTGDTAVHGSEPPIPIKARPVLESPRRVRLIWTVRPFRSPQWVRKTQKPANIANATKR
ncbi:hypothetical protein [Saccharomonospora viridis]|uniref:hypothetical protein n=1 Tax=Saccharomonospora viridis TaxID=1852 RepID=UPI00055B0A18|nr:hypothetical protein [Saccharomonospora viridis]SFP15342.1 hypothetical protein SAMN02982918_1427 [Saccharomonospora viridis]